MKTHQQNGDTPKGSYRKHEVSQIDKEQTEQIKKAGKRFSENFINLYQTERVMLKAIPGMTKNGKSEELVKSLKLRKSIYREQALRLEAISSIFNKKPEVKFNDAIALLKREGEKINHLLSDIYLNIYLSFKYDSEKIRNTAKVELLELHNLL